MTWSRAAAFMTAALLSLALVASVAFAYTTGRYTGAGRDAVIHSISFKAGNQRLRNLHYFLRAPGACSVPGALVDSDAGYVITYGRIQNGRSTVTGTFTGASAKARFTLHARLRGRQANGNLRAIVDFSDGRHCDSGFHPWHASHV